MFQKHFSVFLTLVMLAPTAANAQQVSLFFPSYPVVPAVEMPVVPEPSAPFLPPPDAKAVTATTRGWNGNESLTRATFVAAITRRLYRPSERCFPMLSDGYDYSLLAFDVPKDATYGPDLCTAMRNGIMKGFTDGGFHPDAKVTVEEAAKVLAKAFSLAADPTDPAQPWSENYVKALTDAGVLSADVNLNAPITRDQLSAMFWKLRDLKKQAK
ncbi:MAG: S-layer homology domain-containing protein [Candidatus Peribacteraceae bacterium]|nr:S-layer homology domain-containing protein [Candidatus Peribacteraceae bacterium]MDD5075293.1 S-layer homology domain-containing protein [Candidatus Peribacteraceae bacterium]